MNADVRCERAASKASYPPRTQTLARWLLDQKDASADHELHWRNIRAMEKWATSDTNRKNLQTSPNIFGKVKIDKIGGGWQMKTLCRVLWVCLESLVLTVCGTLRVSYSRFSASRWFTSYTGSVGRRQILCHRHLSLREAQGQSVGTVGIRSSMKWPSR